MAFAVKSTKKSNKTGTTDFLHSNFPDSRTSERTLFHFTYEVKAEGPFPALSAGFTVKESMQTGLPLLKRAASK